ncbi:MAG: winged helix-turn-helix domain-containing protein [Clostridia bacterium]|nr:winged helix-turn-helix domain-containing protein [Clostridia bacterium]
MVLIIDSMKRKAQAISDIFYYMGVLSYAATPSEALSEISGLYSAVLVLNPENLPDAENFVERLRSYDARIPIFAITDASPELYPESIFNGSYPDSIYSSTLVEEIVKYQIRRNLPLTAHYRLAGIDASCDMERVTVFDESIGFTKTETMILRYLISSYPIPQSAKEIIKYSFKPSRKPEITSIRTHVSVMNRKFREIRGKNLFLNIQGKGYVVSTPEILKSLSEAN